MSQLTPQQLDAIGGRGSLLVVAGAGTGKTRTLVSRCLRLLTGERASLEGMLMVTFTEAAAAEMRARIRIEFGSFRRRIRRTGIWRSNWRCWTARAFARCTVSACNWRGSISMSSGWILNSAFWTRTRRGR